MSAGTELAEHLGEVIPGIWEPDRGRSSGSRPVRAVRDQGRGGGLLRRLTADLRDVLSRDEADWDYSQWEQWQPWRPSSPRPGAIPRGWRARLIAAYEQETGDWTGAD
jgi:hypothetical protein